MRRLNRVFAASVASIVSMLTPALARADNACPPGAWFCGKVDVEVPGGPQSRPAIPPQAPPPDDQQDAPPPVRRRPPPPPQGQPPVVVYQPRPDGPPPQVVVVTPGYGYGYNGPYSYQQRPRPAPIAAPAPRWQPEFGLSLRAEGLALGHPNGASYSPAMGGMGVSLRYRPVPHFAFDLGADFLAGTDYNGFSRMEIPISLNGMIFVNPRSRVQFYLIGGMAFSRAEVRSDSPAQQLHAVDGGQYGADYTYFGGQGGAGLEFRLSRRVALDIDGLAFVRRRIDDGRAPEFIDPQTGQTTNTSGGGIFRGGINFWW